MTVSKRKRIPDILGLHVLLCVYTLSKFPQCNRVPSQTTPESISIIFGNWINKPVFTFSAFQCSHCWWKTSLFLFNISQLLSSVHKIHDTVSHHSHDISNINLKWHCTCFLKQNLRHYFKSKITNPSNLFHHLYKNI